MLNVLDDANSQVDLVMISDRIEALCKRIRSRKQSKSKSGHRPGPASLRFEQRRKRIAEHNWSELVSKHNGHIYRIVQETHISKRTVSRYLWDLGLWPEVVRERQARNG